MRFVWAFKRLLECILESDPDLVLYFISKVYLADAYIHIWVQLLEITSVDFLLPQDTKDEAQLVGTHLYILLGYLE